MELKSEPQYELIPVTDIDIAYPGDLQTFTLRQGVDTYEKTPTLITIHMNGGTLEFRLERAHWFAIRHRTIRVAAPAGQSATPTGGVPQPNKG